ncbi:MAG: hypothetical protein AB7P01_07030 [Bacteroidia bacterium]
MAKDGNSIVKAVRKKASNYFLVREYKKVKRKPQALNLSQARNIGILFEVRGKEDVDTVRAFVAQIKERNRKITALGYVTTKELLQTLKSDNEFDFISKEDFNWYYKPEKYVIKNFMSDGMDVLIDLSLKKNPALLYTAAFTEAKMKVARFDEKQKEYYDLMIDIGKDNTLNYLINQIKFYITKINEQSTQ